MTTKYVTAGAWGSGTGAPLNPSDVDDNFYGHETRIGGLETNPPIPISIASFETSGSQFYVHLTDSSILGPYALPQITWNFRGAWTATTVYAAFDVVFVNGGAYMVLRNHTSAATFDPSANDGSGHKFYGLLFALPSSFLPPGGLAGDILEKIDSFDFNTQWGSRFSSVHSAVVATDATWTPIVGDEGKYWRISEVATVIFSKAFSDGVALGAEIEIHSTAVSISAGNVQIIGGHIDTSSDVVINIPDGFVAELAGKHASAKFKKVGTDEWDFVYGLLKAA